jgi:hypothetical protein
MIALILGCGVFAGCGGASLLSGSRAAPSTTTVTSGAYMSQLSAAQAKLAAAERTIPRRPKTPAALTSSITLLASAVRRLGSDLSSIRAPDSVATLHARLVSIVAAYATQLALAARVSSSQGGELQAGKTLIASTDEASRAFSATVGQIESMLGK